MEDMLHGTMSEDWKNAVKFPYIKVRERIIEE